MPMSVSPIISVIMSSHSSHSNRFIGGAFDFEGGVGTQQTTTTNKQKNNNTHHTTHHTPHTTHLTPPNSERGSGRSARRSVEAVSFARAPS